MSSRSDERALQNQVAELRDELRRLQLRVDRQEDQLLEVSRELEESRELSFSAGEAPSSIASATSVSGGYSIVTPVPGPTVAGVPPSWAFRESVAREIGEFLRRALNGSHRGKSGREKLNPLQSRIYVVLRDIEGLVTEHPVRVYTKFSSVKAVCFRSGSCGDSVFVGLPSQKEARLCVEAAGCSWPASFD